MLDQKNSSPSGVEQIFRDRGWSQVSERSETPIAYLCEQTRTWKEVVSLIVYKKNGLLPEETARVSVHIKRLDLTHV